jgi:hypothetical protein
MAHFVTADLSSARAIPRFSRVEGIAGSDGVNAYVDLASVPPPYPVTATCAVRDNAPGQSRHVHAR